MMLLLYFSRDEDSRVECSFGNNPPDGDELYNKISGFFRNIDTLLSHLPDNIAISNTSISGINCFKLYYY